MNVFDWIYRTLATAADLLNGAAFWLVLSFILAGVLHNIISPARLQRMLGNTNLSSVMKATLSGMLLPICSCGVIPLGIGLYYTGACLGPVLAFMAATPILNPAAVLLAYGFLGPQITLAYVLTGLVVSLLIGVAGNHFGGNELQAPGMEGIYERVELEEGYQPTLVEKLRSGLEWGFGEMGSVVSKYVVFGMILVAVIITTVPTSYIEAYLGTPGVMSVLGITLLALVMYVCAVGHIPFVAVLVATGAAPGLAVTFLMVGAASNIPELVSIYKLIGRRAGAIYFTVVTAVAVLAGYLTNLILMPGFVPFFNLDKTKDVVSIANGFLFSAPLSLQYLCTAIILWLAARSVWPRICRCRAGGTSA